jgi:hypothetical protein
MKYKILAVLALLLAMVGVGLFHQEEVEAWCITGQSEFNPSGRPHVPGNWHAGRAVLPGTTVQGVRSVLEEYPTPWLHNSSGATTAWVMVGRQTSDKDHYAQIGWMVRNGDAVGRRRVFTQHTGNAHTYPFTTISNIQQGPDFNHYEVWVGNSKFWYYVNGVLFNSAQMTFIPDIGIVSAETQSFASQMPGGYVDTMAFAASEILIWGQPWKPIGGRQVLANSYYHASWLGGPNASETWDRQCSY